MEDNRVFVARRKLNMELPKWGKCAHSGLLVRIGGKYYLLDMTTTTGKDTVINFVEINSNQVKEETFNCVVEWTKQKVGVQITQNLSINDIYNTMNAIKGPTEYNNTKHNCHMVQEATRYYYKWADNKTVGQVLDYPNEAIALVKAYSK